MFAVIKCAVRLTHVKGQQIPKLPWFQHHDYHGKGAKHEHIYHGGDQQRTWSQSSMQKSMKSRDEYMVISLLAKITLHKKILPLPWQKLITGWEGIRRQSSLLQLPAAKEGHPLMHCPIQAYNLIHYNHLPCQPSPIFWRLLVCYGNNDIVTLFHTSKSANQVPWK